MLYNKFMENKIKGLELFFSPHSIAIVGATEEEGKVGNSIAKNILDGGYAGKVFFVNPNRETVLGQKCYPKVSAIAENIDLAIVIIPAKFVNETIREASEKIKNFAVISAGFAESGKEGEKREKELLEIAEKNDLNVLGPNCLGFINAHQKLNASFAPFMAKEGDIAFISQSGALVCALLDIFSEKKAGFSILASTGNQMLIGESDLMEYLDTDDKTKVIGLYLEGIEDAKKLAEISRKMSSRKPVIILKAGKSERTKKAISSHTGSLAGSEDIAREFFQKNGIIQAENLEEFSNLLNLLSLADAPKNGKVIAITNAGGAGVLATDAFQGKTIELQEIKEETKNKLKEFLPVESSIQNPIDLLGDAMEDRYQKTLEAVENEEADFLICLLTVQKQTPVEKIAEVIANFKQKTSKKIIAVLISSQKFKGATEKLESSGVPVFTFPEQAVGTLEKYFAWRNFKSNPSKESKLDKEKLESISEIISKARKEKRGALFFGEAADIFRNLEIPTIPFRQIVNENDLEKIPGFPVVLKIDSEKIIHKTDKKALILGIKNKEDLKKYYDNLKKTFPNEGIIVQPEIQKDIEIILGMKRDEVFGPVVVAGLGGIYAEVFKKVDYFIPPMNKKEIEEKLFKSPISFIFKETRGKIIFESGIMAEIIEKLMKLSINIPEIKELDINPFIIHSGKGISADIKILI